MVDRLLTGGVHFQSFFDHRPCQEGDFDFNHYSLEYYRGVVILFHQLFILYTKSSLPLQGSN